MQLKGAAWIPVFLENSMDPVVGTAHIDGDGRHVVIELPAESSVPQYIADSVIGVSFIILREPAEPFVEEITTKENKDG